MIRIRGRIPLTITPAFWIFAALIGFLSSMSLIGTLIWVGIIFVSVLFHEMGHALTALFFGQRPRIELIALGGVTLYQAEKLSFWKQFAIVFNGPLFGFLLFLAALFLRMLPPLATGMPAAILLNMQWVNLFWTLLNLLPVLPLDGGQLLRIPLEALFGLKGFRYALFVSMAVAGGISLVAFLFQYFLVGAILFLFAFQSFESWRKSRSLSESDRDDGVKALLSRGEKALERGERELAHECFSRVRRSAKRGVAFLLASQYLAFLASEAQEFEEVYSLLLPLRKELAPEALCLLQRAAFIQEDYSLVEELAGPCFQAAPSVDTALRAAYACGFLKKTQAALGWFDAAVGEGLENATEVLADRSFDAIRSDPLFEQALRKSGRG